MVYGFSFSVYELFLGIWLALAQRGAVTFLSLSCMVWALLRGIPFFPSVLLFFPFSKYRRERHRAANLAGDRNRAWVRQWWVLS